MAHLNNRLPSDGMTAAQVEEVRQRLREFWPTGRNSQDVGRAIKALADKAQISTGILRTFKQGRYKGDNRAIAWHLADFFGVKIVGKE